MRGLVAVVLVAFMVVQSGCGLFGEDTVIDITTDRSLYPQGSTIHVTAKNVSNDVLYYNSCMPTALEELSNGKVARQTFLPNCECLCTTELKPGEVWEARLEVDWFWANDGLFQPNVGPRHRFRFEFYRDRKLDRLVRSEDLTTNAFRFEREDEPASEASVAQQ